MQEKTQRGNVQREKITVKITIERETSTKKEQKKTACESAPICKR